MKIWFINGVDKPNFRVSLPHRRSTTVSIETNPLYSIINIRSQPTVVVYKEKTIGHWNILSFNLRSFSLFLMAWGHDAEKIRDSKFKCSASIEQ